MNPAISGISSPAARFASTGSAPMPLRFGADMSLYGHAVVDRLSRALPALAADLLEIAASVHAIDRLVPRPTERQRPPRALWARSLWADIPVREPERWRQQTPLLSQVLHWLTDDDWALEFSQLQPGAGVLDTIQQFLFDTVPASAVPFLLVSRPPGQFTRIISGCSRTGSGRSTFHISGPSRARRQAKPSIR